MTVKDIRGQLKGVHGSKHVVFSLELAGVQLPCEVREIVSSRFGAVISLYVPTRDILEENLEELKGVVEKL